jgi:hypothetical protein
LLLQTNTSQVYKILYFEEEIRYENVNDIHVKQVRDKTPVGCKRWRISLPAASVVVSYESLSPVAATANPV